MAYQRIPESKKRIEVRPSGVSRAQRAYNYWWGDVSNTGRAVTVATVIGGGFVIGAAAGSATAATAVKGVTSGIGLLVSWTDLGKALYDAGTGIHDYFEPGKEFDLGKGVAIGTMAHTTTTAGAAVLGSFASRAKQLWYWGWGEEEIVVDIAADAAAPADVSATQDTKEDKKEPCGQKVLDAVW